MYAIIPISLLLPCVHSPATPWSPSLLSPKHRPPATLWGSFHLGWNTSLHSSPCRWALCSRALPRNAPRPDGASAQWSWCSLCMRCCSSWRGVWISQTRQCRRSGDLFLQLLQLVGFSSRVRLCLKCKIIGYVLLLLLASKIYTLFMNYQEHLRKVPNHISQSLGLHLQISCFVWATVKTPKILNLQ